MTVSGHLGVDGIGTEVSTLGNGVRVVSYRMPHVETVSLGVWVNVGARHESKSENGISHFLEHMAFKGTEQRTARDIAEEIEQVGGELNAATSLETTAYYARVLKADVGLALELIADILQNPRYSLDDLEREREVILQEIASTRDSPEEIAYDLMNEIAYPEQPLGRPILGTQATVKKFSTEDIRGFLRRHYTANRIVVAAAGKVDHDALVRLAEKLFGQVARSTEVVPDIVTAAYRGGARASDKAFEQSHLLLGFEGPHYRDPTFYTAQVFSGLFGGGMSSRLFQEVRERRGLCYSIYSGAWGLADTGMFSIYSATGPEMMPELIGVVRGEFERAATTVPEAREVERSKAQLKAGLMMSFESSGARVEQIARQVLVHNRIFAANELIERVEAVTPQNIRDFAQGLLERRPASAVVVGAGKKSGALATSASLSFRQTEHA